MSSRSTTASKKGDKKKKGDGSKPSTAMSSVADPMAEIARLRQELDKERQERNYFQLEKDKLQGYWEITQQQLASSKAQLLLKDRNIEELEERHRAEIKVYKQKVKHLVYEYQSNLSRVEVDAEKHLDIAVQDHEQDLDSLKRQVRALKIELKEMELSHQELVKSMRLKQEQELVELRTDFDRRCKELYNKYANKTRLLREELELQRRNELHQLEERKNAQINSLLRSHEKSFSEIKNYYNDITVNNLALINSLKEQVEELKKKDERSERLVADISAENKRLKEPLDAALAECDQLRRQLKNYEKDKLALKNCKARLKVIEEQNRQLQWEKEILTQRFQQLEKERDELYNEFSQKCADIQLRAGLKNILLEKKVSSVRTQLDKREVALREVISTLTQDGDLSKPVHKVHLPDLRDISDRASKLLDTKADQLEKIRLDLHRMTKLYSDLRTFCETKLVEDLGHGDPATSKDQQQLLSTLGFPDLSNRTVPSQVPATQ